MIRLDIPGDDAKAEKVFQKYVEFKQLCEYPIQLSVCLNLHADLPSEDFLLRFYSEKLFGCQFQMDCFITNSKGFPVLSKQHTKICREFMKIQARMILSPKLPNENLERYYSYLTHVFANHDKLD